MGYPNLSSLAVCVPASPASRNEELSDARLSNRSDPQAGKISPRTRRRRRLAPSARLHRLRLHSRPHRTRSAGAGTAKRRVAPKPGGEFRRCSPRRRRQPRTSARADRRELLKMLKVVAPGDVVTVTRIDRLARSTFDLFAIVKQIVDAGAQFRSLAEPWADTATSTRRIKDVERSRYAESMSGGRERG